MNNKIFILEPRAGLCNKINCITIGIVLGILYKRDLYFNGFQIDYMNENILTNFDNIIDVSKLKKICKKYNIKILDNIDFTIDDVPILNTNNEIINDTKDIFSYLSLEDNLNIHILNLKNPISTFIPDEHQELYNNIKLNIKFNQKFYKIAKDIKKQYKLDNYCCVHLRMEDDAIDFIEKKMNKDNVELINDIYKQTYIQELERLFNLDLNIYVCTSLCMFENKNNLFYKIIKKKYNLIDKNDIIKNYDLNNDLNNEYNQRELYGIVDYIIALDSEYFTGCDWSSFSIAIKNNHMHNNKMYNLLNIWNMCANS